MYCINLYVVACELMFYKIGKCILLHDFVPHTIITWSNKYLPCKSSYTYICKCETLDAA